MQVNGNSRQTFAAITFSTQLAGRPAAIKPSYRRPPHGARFDAVEATNTPPTVLLQDLALDRQQKPRSSCLRPQGRHACPESPSGDFMKDCRVFVA